jgi:hypothetical protein
MLKHHDIEKYERNRSHIDPNSNPQYSTTFIHLFVLETTLGVSYEVFSLRSESMVVNGAISDL